MARDKIASRLVLNLYEYLNSDRRLKHVTNPITGKTVLASRYFQYFCRNPESENPVAFERITRLPKYGYIKAVYALLTHRVLGPENINLSFNTAIGVDALERIIKDDFPEVEFRRGNQVIEFLLKNEKILQLNKWLVRFIFYPRGEERKSRTFYTPDENALAIVDRVNDGEVFMFDLNLNKVPHLTESGEVDYVSRKEVRALARRLRGKGMDTVYGANSGEIIGMLGNALDI